MRGGKNTKPSRFVIVRHQLVNNGLDADEPDGDGAIDEWRSRPEFRVIGGCS